MATETLILKTGSFKIGDEVTILSNEHINNHFPGKHGKIIKFDPEKNRNGEIIDPECCIVVDVRGVKKFLFNSHHNSEIPQEEKTWVTFKQNEIIPREKPQTPAEAVEEIIEDVKAYRYYILREPADNTCLVQDCQNPSDICGYGIYNVWGSIYIFRACPNHLKEFSGRWCEERPFEAKRTDLIAPPWLEKSNL